MVKAQADLVYGIIPSRMAGMFKFQQRVERVYYNHGLFMSNNPVIMICISAVVMLFCCYPLLNLPLPGSEPTEFLTPQADFQRTIYTAGKLLPYQSSPVAVHMPAWFEADKQVAYVQQIIVKSVVDPWNENDMIPTDAYRAPLAKLFSLMEEIENFHLEEEEEAHSVAKECLHVTETIIKQGQGIKPLFPEYGCLILSPASFWSKSSQGFQNDPNILHTMHKYQGKTIETSPSIKELLFGVPSKESGVNNFIVRNRQRVVTYTITLVLKSYDHKMVTSLRNKMKELYPSQVAEGGKNKRCNPDEEGANCENSSDSGGNVPVITHIYFKSQIGFNELIPLLSTYFIMGCYIYFSVRKINFVKSKLGMAFSAVVSIMASLMMSVGLCSLFGLTPTLNGGEIFPYLVIVIGLENILVITKSVVATPIHLEVDKRIALGLSREGCSITKNLLLELVLIGLGYFTYVPEIQEFCAFAVVGILSDYFMHMIFFTTVLSIDIRRLDITEDIYIQPGDSETEDEKVDTQHNRWARPDTNHQRTTSQRLRSNRRKRKSKTDGMHTLETGGKSVTILKIPRRLRVLFFWADTRMVQRGLMVFMVIWFALLMYGDPFGSMKSIPVTPAPMTYQTATLAPVPEPTQSSFSIFRHEKKQAHPEIGDGTAKLVWTHTDLMLYRRLSFRHWPSLFGYYNMTLAGRFVSILPPIPATVVVPPEYAIKSRHSSETSKQQNLTPADNVHQDDNMSQQLPPDSYTGRYPMTGLDYYLTLLLGAISGMMMVFLLTVMYKCICNRNYGRRLGPRNGRNYQSSVGDSMPLVLAGHPQLVECITADENLLVSADLSGELRVWDVHSGDCTCVIYRVQTPVPERDPVEGAIDAKPTPVGYQERDRNDPPFVNYYQSPIDLRDMDVQIARGVTSPNLIKQEREAIPTKNHRRQTSWHSTNRPYKTHHRSGSGSNIPVDLGGAYQGPAMVWPPPFSPEISLLPTVQTNFTSIAKEKSEIRKRTPAAGNSRGDTSASSEFSSSLHSSRGNLELGEGDSNIVRKSSNDSSLTEGDVDSTKGYDFQGLFHDHYMDYVKLYSDTMVGTSCHVPRVTQPVTHQPLSQRHSMPPQINSTPIYPHLSHTYPYCNNPMVYPGGSNTPVSSRQQLLLNPCEITGRYSSAEPSSSPPNQVGAGFPHSVSLDENTRQMWGSWESGLGVATPRSRPASWGSAPGSPVEMENGPSVWCMVCVYEFVITGCENGRIEVWDSKSGVLKCTHDVGKAGVCGLMVADQKIVTARINGSLDFFSMEATYFHPTPVQYRGPSRARNDADKPMLDMMCSDVLTLQLVYTVKSAHQQPITAFKMAMGRVLTGSCDHTLKLFTLNDARCLFTLYGHAGAITALCMDQGPPAGAASGAADGTVRLWDLFTGECLHKFDEHNGDVTAVQCSTFHVVSTAQDDKLCIWDRRSGMLIHVRRLDPGCSSGMCLLGSSWCVTGGLGVVSLWDMRNGELVRRVRLLEESSGLASRVTQLIPVGDLSVACDVGRELRIVRFPSVLEKIE